jgi:hypothetical protein
MNYLYLVFFFNKNYKNVKIIDSLTNICQLLSLDLKSKKDNVIIFFNHFFVNRVNILPISNE